MLMPEEQEGELKFNYRWNELLKSSFAKAGQSGPFLENCHDYDLDIVGMFATPLYQCLDAIIQMPVYHAYQLKIFSLSFSILESLCSWATHLDIISFGVVFERILWLLLSSAVDSSDSHFVTEVFKSTLMPLSLVEDRMVPIINAVKTTSASPLTALETRRVFIIIRLVLFLLGFLDLCRRIPIPFMMMEDFMVGRHLTFFSKKVAGLVTPKPSQVSSSSSSSSSKLLSSHHTASIFSSWGLSTLTSYLSLGSSSTHRSDTSLLVEGISTVPIGMLDLANIKKKFPDLYPGASLSFIDEVFGPAFTDLTSFFSCLSPASLSDKSFLGLTDEMLAFIQLYLSAEHHFNLEGSTEMTTASANELRIYTPLKELISFYTEILFIIVSQNVTRICLVWDQLLVFLTLAMQEGPATRAVEVDPNQQSPREVAMVLTPFRAFCCERITVLILRLFQRMKEVGNATMTMMGWHLLELLAGVEDSVFEVIAGQLLSWTLKYATSEQQQLIPNGKGLHLITQILQRGLFQPPEETSLAFQAVSTIITERIEKNNIVKDSADQDGGNDVKKPAVSPSGDNLDTNGGEIDEDREFVDRFTGLLFSFLLAETKTAPYPEYLYQSFTLLGKLFSMRCKLSHFRVSGMTSEFELYFDNLLLLATRNEKKNALVTLQNSLLSSGLVEHLSACEATLFIRSLIQLIARRLEGDVYIDESVRNERSGVVVHDGLGLDLAVDTVVVPPPPPPPPLASPPYHHTKSGMVAKMDAETSFRVLLLLSKFMAGMVGFLAVPEVAKEFLGEWLTFLRLLKQFYLVHPEKPMVTKEAILEIIRSLLDALHHLESSSLETAAWEHAWAIVGSLLPDEEVLQRSDDAEE